MGHMVYSAEPKSLREIIEESHLYLGSTCADKEIDVTQLILAIGRKIKEVLLLIGQESKDYNYYTEQGCMIDDIVKSITKDV